MTSPTDRRRGLELTLAAVVGAVLGVLVVETTKFLQERVATTLVPLIAAALATALFGVIVYFVWHVLRDPTRRLAERTRDHIDYRFQRSRAVEELERRVAAFEEEQRVRALAASARVHERAARAITDGTLRLELDELKGRSEEVVMRSQSVAVARLLARYEAAYLRLTEAEHMSAAEKARLVEDLRRLLEEETTRRDR